MPQSGRVILISGGNNGIGWETVRLLSEQHPNDTILLGSRDVKKGNEARDKIKSNQNVHVVQLDVTKQESIDKIAELIKKDYHGHLSVLVNNAGIASFQHTLENAKATLDVNYFGLKAMCHKLGPMVQENGAIVNVTSEVGCWALFDSKDDLKQKLLNPDLTESQLNSIVQQFFKDVESGNDKQYALPTFPSYAFSKNAANAFVRLFAKSFKGQKNVTVLAACPGYCATALNHFKGPRSAETGGKSIVTAIDTANPDKNGTFQQDGKVLPWQYKAHMEL